LSSPRGALHNDPSAKVVIQAGYQFPYDLDNIGGLENENHIAIVHIDGNSIGKRLQNILEVAGENGRDDNALTTTLREFSVSVMNAAEKTTRQMLNDLIKTLPDLRQDKKITLVEGRNNKLFFPLRLLIYGGDDLTFVCEGRLGLALAARYLTYFGRESDSLGNKFSACAGVVIARNHFPLARAYQLSEELCNRAKKETRKESGKDPASSWLDFHIIFSGLTGRLAQMRPYEKKDAIPAKHPQILLWRPWCIIGTRHDNHPWEYLRQQLLNFQRNWSRSQVKDLREALAGGKTATGQFLAQAARRGYTLYQLPELLLLDGWDGRFTPLYDPIEALDFYLDLKE
jgi:hypothetical protein